MFQTSSVIADDWDIGIGGGVFVAPEYLGSDDLETFAVPAFDIAYQGRFFFNFFEGFSAYLYRDDLLKLKGSLAFDEGRDEDDDSALEGLGDIDDSEILKLAIEFQVGQYTPFISLQKHYGGTDGTQAQIGIQSLYLLREDLTSPIILLNLAFEYSDEDYVAGYFGVDAEQSVRSGLPVYSPDAGLNAVTFGAAYVYPFAKKWRFTTLLQYLKITGDAADSPVVKEDTQVFGGAFVSYRF